MNVRAMLKYKTVFEQDADIFHPERFLEADTDTRAQMERQVEMVFGHGRYICAGKAISFAELTKSSSR